MANQTIQLYDYNIWANNRVIEHLKSMPAETFFKEMDFGFISIAEVVGHLVSADEVWLARIKEVSPPPLTAATFATIEEASSRMRELQSRFRGHLLTIEDCDRKVTYLNTMGQQFRNSTAEMIQHVVNHGTYHRGNITTMVRALGCKGVQTDYIAYLRAIESDV